MKTFFKLLLAFIFAAALAVLWETGSESIAIFWLGFLVHLTYSMRFNR